MKISNLIFLSFFFILLLFSITTYINYRQAEAVKENAEFISTSTQVMKNTSRFQRNIWSMVGGLRGYLITGEKYFISSYDSAISENDQILRELLLLVPDSSVQEGRLREIKVLNDQWVENYAEPLKHAKTLSIIHDSNLYRYQKMYREKMMIGNEQRLQSLLQDKFREFSNYEYDTRDTKKTILATSVQVTKRISLILTIISVVVSLTIVIFLAHRISSRIISMGKLANEISSGNYSVHIPDTGQDELSRLSRELNNMAHTLSENISLLKRKNQELDQFAHIVSHDLKGPLRGIDNVVTWIEEDHLDELSPKVKEYLDLVRGRIVRAENLIEGILSYARIGKEKIPKETVSINVLLGEVVENIGIQKKITFDIQQEMPVIETEKIPLYQIFYNLIGNAVKYNDKDNGEISVYYKDRGNNYEFFVADNGPGISRNYHDKIFVIFQTLNDRDTVESTGVGLAIVKKILDEKKETIRVSSEPGKGSVFSFTWPKK